MLIVKIVTVAALDPSPIGNYGASIPKRHETLLGYFLASTPYSQGVTLPQDGLGTEEPKPQEVYGASIDLKHLPITFESELDSAKILFYIFSRRMKFFLVGPKRTKSSTALCGLIFTKR